MSAGLLGVGLRGFDTKQEHTDRVVDRDLKYTEDAFGGLADLELRDDLERNVAVAYRNANRGPITSVEHAR